MSGARTSAQHDRESPEPGLPGHPCTRESRSQSGPMRYMRELPDSPSRYELTVSFPHSRCLSGRRMLSGCSNCPGEFCSECVGHLPGYQPARCPVSYPYSRGITVFRVCRSAGSGRPTSEESRFTTTSASEPWQSGIRPFLQFPIRARKLFFVINLCFFQ